MIKYLDSKVHGANMGLIWGRQDPGGLHVGPMNFATWVCNTSLHSVSRFQQDKQLTIDTDDILVTGSCYSWNMSQYFRVLLPGATLSKISQEILRHDADFKHTRFRCHSDSLTWSDFKLFIFLNKWCMIVFIDKYFIRYMYIYTSTEISLNAIFHCHLQNSTLLWIVASNMSIISIEVTK